MFLEWHSLVVRWMLSPCQDIVTPQRIPVQMILITITVTTLWKKKYYVMFFITPSLKNGIIKSIIIELSLFDWVWKQSSIDYHFVVAVHPLYIKTFGTLFVFVLPDVILRLSITMTSWWARWRLKSPASRLFIRPFIRAQIKANVKAPRHWPLCVGNSPGTGEFPAQMASNAENVSIWWRHHWLHQYPSWPLSIKRVEVLDVTMIVSLWNLTGISAA